MNGEEFGSSCALNAEGNILVVGSPKYLNETSYVYNAGKIQVFKYYYSNWNNTYTLLGTTNESLGTSCSINAPGNIVAFASPNFKNINYNIIGKIQVIEESNSNWIVKGGSILGD